MKKIALLCFSLLMSNPFPSTASTYVPCATQQLFASEQEAVIAAMNSFNPASIAEDREYMGTIYREGSLYGYSVARGTRHRDRFTLRLAGDEWDRVSALWHTHGDAYPSNRYFSDSDTRLVNRYKKPLYLGDYTGYLKRFSPGDRRLSPYAARRLGLPARSGFAIGEVVRDENRRVIRIRTRRDSFS
ncbi:MAG: DUF4329 domain-containing protein [Pseudomonadales bacterium]|nr:DUF4329 domain-containing protein [Pseudomonadales bacterium]